MYCTVTSLEMTWQVFLQVTRVVLLWVNNHFHDFETDGTMSDFLERFEKLLEKEVRVNYNRKKILEVLHCVKA